jgi:hypothetical protein
MLATLQETKWDGSQSSAWYAPHNDMEKAVCITHMHGIIYTQATLANIAASGSDFSPSAVKA